MAEGETWERYGRALTGAMAEVLEEIPEETRAHALETADYWLSVGLVIGLERPSDAARLLELIESDAGEHAPIWAVTALGSWRRHCRDAPTRSRLAVVSDGSARQ